MNILLTLLDDMPDWLAVILGAAISAAAWRLLGWRGLTAGVAALVVALAYKKGQSRGIEEVQRKVDAGNLSVVKQKKAIEDKVHGMSPKEIDDANARWIRRS